VLQDFSVIGQPENVDSGPITVAWPFLMAMQDLPSAMTRLKCTRLSGYKDTAIDPSRTAGGNAIDVPATNVNEAEDSRQAGFQVI
jgi:hypothetical protein